jgi:formate dehydrogenase major subunit
LRLSTVRPDHFDATPCRSDPYDVPDRAKESAVRKPKGRLTTPLVRDGGELRAATWDEALDRAAAGFGRARDAGAETSFGIFSCSKASNEMNFLAQKLARQVMGTNNLDSCNRT